MLKPFSTSSLLHVAGARPCPTARIVHPVPMNPTPLSPRTGFAHRSLHVPLLFLPLAAWAQVSPLAPGSAGNRTEDAAVELNPFVVSTNRDVGYRATTSLAGTRINADLRDLGAAISVVTA